MDEITERFCRNVESVYELVNLDRIVLDFAIAQVSSLQNVQGIGRLEANAVENAVRALQNVRNHDSLRPIYQVITKFTGKGDNVVASGYPKYDEETVWINGEQGFASVPEDVWEFHVGGYQVCNKWLKDWRGRELSAEDKTYYGKIEVALKETIRLMEEIDEAIPSWPIE